jgi:hypothetical protein
MIHYTPEGHHMKLGLNLRRTAGGFAAIWAWYDFATYKAFSARFRLRLHIKPRILWSVERFNVISNYLAMNDLELVSREVLEDLRGSEIHAAKEREACAEICKKHADVYAMLEQNPTTKSAWAACIDNLDAIRARGQA